MGGYNRAQPSPAVDSAQCAGIEFHTDFETFSE
jgi:hypothetical protein